MNNSRFRFRSTVFAPFAAGTLLVVSACGTGPSSSLSESVGETTSAYSTASPLMPFGGQYGTCISETSTGTFTVTGCNGATAQAISILAVPGTPYASLQTSSGACLGFVPQNGAAPYWVANTVNACNTPYTEWLVQGGQLVSAFTVNGMNYCLDINDGNPSSAGNALVDVTECNGTNSQVFWVTGIGVAFESSYEDLTDDYHECLGALPNDVGLENTDCSDVAAQRWVLGENQQITLSSNPALCIGLNVTPPQGDYSPISLQACSPSNVYQKWYFINRSGSNSNAGQVMIVNAGGGICLDILNGNSFNGETVDAYYCGGYVQQMWSPFLPYHQPQECVPMTTATACSYVCGGEVSNGCGGTVTCPEVSAQLCCMDEGGAWYPNPAPGHCLVPKFPQ